MIVIADSGSTKTDWCIGNSQTDYRIVQTPGINPFYLSTKEISRQITENLFPQLTEKDTVTELYFYGAGCTPEKACIVADALTECFPHAHVAVESDLSGAARALCGHTKGIACILGTGSNSCEYDGEKIVSNVSPLGYILGDEGSGAVLGKRLVGDCLKKQLPPDLCELLLKEYELTPALILDKVYRQPLANRFLASLTPFLSAHRQRAEIHALLLSCFTDFFERNVMLYEYAGCPGSFYRFHRMAFPDGGERSSRCIGHSSRQDNKESDGRVDKLSFQNMSFIKITEQPSLHEDLEQLSVRSLLEGINEEDQKVALAVRSCIPHIERLVTGIVERMQQGGRVFYIGAGTSGRLGVLDASEIPPTFGMPDTYIIGIIAGGETALRHPVENAEDDTLKGWEELQAFHISDKDTVIGIAASGTTPYVIGALQQARKRGILTAGISSNPDSPLSHAVDIPIEMIVGPEFVTGSSRMKSGTGQKMILNMISTSVMIKLGRVKGNRMVNMQLSNQKLVDRGMRMIMEELQLDEKKAKQLLQKYGSVKKVLDIYNKK